MPLAAGSRLGPYEIVTPLGAGGMGEVYRARDTRLHRDVALKVLPDAFAADPDRVRRFQQEARAVAALSHPHICQIFDVGPDYLVLEYVEGTPLRGPLPERDVIQLALQIASALQVAHARGILHRDLKPANVLMTRARGSAAAGGLLPNHPTASDIRPLELPTAKLLDFGIAKWMTAAPDETQTVDGVVIGTAAYMSPEQATGKPVDARSDIFSFGAVVYELLSGRRAFDGGSTAEVLSAVLRDPPPPLDASPALERLVAKCLEKEPGRRYQSTSEVVHGARETGQSTGGPSIEQPPHLAGKRCGGGCRNSSHPWSDRIQRRWLARSARRHPGGISDPVARSSSSRQPVRRGGAGVLRRRHDRCANQRAGPHSRAQGDLAHVGHALQERAQAAEADCGGAGGGRRDRRLGAAGGRSDPDQRQTDSRRHRSTRLVGQLPKGVAKRPDTSE